MAAQQAFIEQQQAHINRLHEQINEMNVAFKQLEQERDALKAIIASCHIDKEMLMTDI